MPNYMKYINVNNFKFDPLAAMPTIPATLQYSSVARNTPSYYLVQFNGPVTPDMKKALAATDVTILYYVAYNTFIVRADGPAIDRAAALPSVRWTGVFEPAYKLSPRLSDEFGALAQRAMDRARYGDQASSDAVTVVGPGMSSKTLTLNSAASTVTAAGKSVSPVSSSLGGRSSAPSGAEAASATIPVEIMAFEPSGVPEIVRAVSFLGGHQTSYSFGQTGGVRAELSKSVIEKLARVPGVMYIDRFVQPYVMNDLARWVVQRGDTVNHATPAHDHGIFATNQTITIGDTGIDYKHPDFWDPNNATPGPTARKLTAYYKDCGNTNHCDLNDNGINHGTHTSGSAGGRRRVARLRRRCDRVERHDGPARWPVVRRVPQHAGPVRRRLRDLLRLRDALVDRRGRPRIVDPLEQLGIVLQLLHPRGRRPGHLHLEQPGLPRPVRRRQLRFRPEQHEPLRRREERDRRRRHGERAGPGERGGLQQPRPRGRWPAQAGRHGPGRLPLVGPGTGPGRRRDRLLDPERHQHGHPDRRRERRPGAPILYGRLVPDWFEVRRGRLHPVRRTDQGDDHQQRPRDERRGGLRERREQVPERQPRVRPGHPRRCVVLPGRRPRPDGRRSPQRDQHRRHGDL